MKAKIMVSIVFISFLSIMIAYALTPPSQASIAIQIGNQVPAELNPINGGAPGATTDQAAAFAWQEFIALNWPAGPQNGQPNQRDTPSSSFRFGDPSYVGPTTWETFRGKVEIFPGNGASTPPPGYPGPTGDTSFGYDALPQYRYSPGLSILPIYPDQANDPVPWVNLDETDQITLDNMYAGIVAPDSSPGNSSPQLIRFLAKANRAQYVYVAGNSSPTDATQQWWSHIPREVTIETKNYLNKFKTSPPAGSKTMVSLPNGTIEVKAAWRPLNPAEAASGRFHTQTVRFYETPSGDFKHFFYTDAVWGLVALHIIQKTPSAPYFIYATFEQSDNILTADGKPVEDVDGNIIANPKPTSATTPQVCLVDPKPTSPPAGATATPSTLGSVILSSDPSSGQPLNPPSYCSMPGSRLYYMNSEPQGPNFNNSAPDAGSICIERRDNPIPDYAITANVDAHQAMASYFKQVGIRSAPWLYYKLINIQYFPYDKLITNETPNGSLYTSQPPYTAQHPASASYYQANIVVETNRSLQLFSGGLTPNICTDWNQDGSPHKNTIYGGRFYNMGGCMGCHGSQGQTPGGLHLNPSDPVGSAGDFSVILARGSVLLPETPSLATSQGLTSVPRNRNIAK